MASGSRPAKASRHGRKPCEISRSAGARGTCAAEALRITLVELVLRITDTAQAERTDAARRNELLIAELNHRVRNILGLVRGLIGQTALHTDDAKTLVDGVSDRIGSLARAFDLLSSANWQSASLHELLRTEIDAFDQSHVRITMAGPDVMLQPKAFAAMALVCHELVTNARKHGALTVPSGRISIESTTDPDGSVGIVWREMGGPPVTAPERRGFGYTILAEVIPFEVDGISTPEFSPSGFTLAIAPGCGGGCVRRPTPSGASVGLEGIGLGSRPVVGGLPCSETVCSLRSTSRTCCANLARSASISPNRSARRGVDRSTIYSFALLDNKAGMGNSLPWRALLPTGRGWFWHRLWRGAAGCRDGVGRSCRSHIIQKSLARVLSRLRRPPGIDGK